MKLRNVFKLLLLSLLASKMYFCCFHLSLFSLFSNFSHFISNQKDLLLVFLRYVDVILYFACTFAFDFVELMILWKLQRQERVRIVAFVFSPWNTTQSSKQEHVYASKSQFAVFVGRQHRTNWTELFHKKSENRQLLCRRWNDNYFSI